MNIPSLPLEFWTLTLTLFAFAISALVRFAIHLNGRRWDIALGMAGLSFTFIAMWFVIVAMPLRDADNALATHRHTCIMYELALQRNANPDLPNVTIDPAWHDLECYPTP